MMGEKFMETYNVNEGSATKSTIGNNDLGPYFSKEIEQSLIECQLGRTGLGVLMFDLDHFKSVNDSTNHLVGSYVIAEIGKIIQYSNILERFDLAARYGGDEFILVLYNINLATAQHWTVPAPSASGSLNPLKLV